MKGAYGEKMIKKLKNMKVAVFGLRGTGIETAKNLLLAGPHTVMVHDDESVVAADLGSNFYLSEADVGKARSKGCQKELSDINPNTYFDVHSGPVTTDLLAKFSTVVFTDLQNQWPLSKLFEFDKFCSAKGIKFIWSGMFGMHTATFSDFGKNHDIFDQDDSPERSMVVAEVECAPAPYEKIEEFLAEHLPKYFDIKKMGYNAKKENGIRLLEEKLKLKFSPKRRKNLRVNEILDMAEASPITAPKGKFAGKITCEGVSHLMHSGDWMKFEEIEMTKGDCKSDETATFKYGEKITNINSTVQLKRHRTNPRVFYIGDISALGSYIKGGIGNQKKMSVFKDYQLLEKQLFEPKIEPGVQNFMKFGVANKLHLGLVAIMSFHDENKRLPKLMDAGDAKKVIDLAKKIKEDKGMYFEVDEELLTKMAYYATTETNAVAAISGGIVAQEAMKQTGKYSPIDQWIHFDAFELVEKAERKTSGGRYSHYEALFGEDFVKNAHGAKFFLVGCGALGCEFLKNIAMMGLGSKGAINITDDDVIELSNLSRQFLFRRKHVSKLKSESAAGVATEMNPELKGGMNVYKIRVEPKTENVFNAKFWKDIDFVINALDNIHARKYMDGKCALHGKPLFESGTLGTRANCSVHIPHKTPSYSDGSTPGEGQGIAMCTLTNFPYEPVHCIEWSRTMFRQMFEDGPAAYEDMRQAGIEKFLEKVSSNENEGLPKLQNALKWAELAKTPTAKTCVKLAFDIFIDEYRDKVKDLINTFPEDHKDAKTGAAFWRGRKRFPVAQEWDVKNDIYVDFIYHTACIFADVLGVAKHKNGRDGYPTRAACAEIAASLPVPEWKAKTVEVEEEGEKKKAAVFSNEDYEVLEKLKKQASAIDTSKLSKLEPGDFEKDDDSNHHIAWITSSANLRADTRKIKRSESHHCRMIAGRIIAAIATTTASITGFVFLEVYKQLLEIEDINRYNWQTINLATNAIVSEVPPDPVRKYTKTTIQKVEEDNKIINKKLVTIAIPEDFTCYDYIDIKGDLTFKELVEQFPKVFQGGLKLTAVFAGKSLLFQDTDPSHFVKARERYTKMLAKVKSAGHKKNFQRMIDNANKSIENLDSKKKLKVSDSYFQEVGRPADPDQPFLVLQCSVDCDPNMPAWMKARLPKKDDNNDVDYVTPDIRLWYK